MVREWNSVFVQNDELQWMKGVLDACGDIDENTVKVLSRFLMASVLRFDADEEILRPRFEFHWIRNRVDILNSMLRYLVKWGDFGSDEVTTWACITIDTVLCYISGGYKHDMYPWSFPEIYFHDRLIQSRNDFRDLFIDSCDKELLDAMRPYGVSLERDYYLGVVTACLWQWVFGFKFDMDHFERIMCSTGTNHGVELLMKGLIIGYKFIEDVGSTNGVNQIVHTRNNNRFIYSVGGPT